MARGTPIVGPSLLVLAAIAAIGRADIIHLRRGRVEGEVLQRDPHKVVVQTRAGKVVLDAADVVRIERKSTPLSVYRETAAKLKDDDAAGHYALGLWCIDHRLSREARLEFLKTVQTDPNHKGARAKLGYVLHNGRWMTQAQAKEADGLVLHKGKWVRPEERDREQRRKAVAAWRQRLRRAIGAGPMTAESIGGRLGKAVGEQPDPEAHTALRTLLHELFRDALDKRHDRTEQVRLALVEATAHKPSAETITLLRRMAVQDRDELVRTAALKVLAAQKNVANTAYFVGLLRRFTGERYRIEGTKRTRTLARRYLRRAAIALGELGDPRAVPALAQTLVVRFHIAESTEDIPPMTIGFSANRLAGGTVVTDTHGNQMVVPVREGTNWGLGPQEEAKPVEDGFFFNEAAYTALRRLTGEDFGHSRRAWLAWWYRNRHNLID